MPTMKLFDSRFRRHKLRYVLQCLLATVVVMVILFILDAIQNAGVVAALGASSFIAFAMPHAKASRPRYLLGGYLVGVAAAGLCVWLASLPQVAQLPAVERYGTVMFGALAVGVAMLGMAITNTEHPPAAGVALGLVLGGWSSLTVMVILMGISALVIAKALLGPLLRDLIEPGEGSRRRGAATSRDV